MISTLVLIPILAAQAPIELRGNAGTLDQPIAAVSIAGVRLEGDAPRTISWDRVRAVAGDRAADAEAFMAIADAAWRARTRLERGDIELAAPLFERLFDDVVLRYGAVSGATGAVIAHGLLRCRLERGDTAAAIEPWLWAAAFSAGPEGGADASIDAATLLCPALAPMFLGGPAAGALGESPGLARLAAEAGPVGGLAAWTRAAARFEAGLPAELPAPDPAADTHPGVAFVRDIVLARAGDSGQRDAARARLLERPGDVAWQDAWRHAAIGRSRLMEADPSERVRGVLSLLRVPALHAREQPRLAELALAECVAELRRTGDGAGASSLQAELTSRGSSAALRWLTASGTLNPSSRAASARPGAPE